MTRKAIAICSLVGALTSAGVFAKDRQFTDEFPIGECTFQTTGGNPYFILQPGRELHYSNQSCVDEGECTELEELVITVTGETRDITFPINGVPTTVTTRIVESARRPTGLVEISRNFFAECAEPGRVYRRGVTSTRTARSRATKRLAGGVDGRGPCSSCRRLSCWARATSGVAPESPDRAAVA